ncbi:signal-regulatory protein beta-2-like [Osmerus mordax]|uniref:signal-regulatory protein beta-2-like n=1 Tax=Osmerus mordax TaxID=8014 RepID=UPI00350FFC08
MISIRHICVLLLSQLYLNESEDIHQNMNLTIAEHGGTVTLPCAVSEDYEMLYWYKQTIGHMPQLVADQTKNGGHKKYLGERFSAKIVDGNYVLQILNITSSDKGIYFCVKAMKQKMEFRNGAFVVARGNHLLRSDYQTVLQQPESEPVHPGDSVTLQCSVLPESCTGQHSVFWFRAGAGESHPGLLYTQGDRSVECEKRPETPSPTRSCVYSLSKNNVSSSDSGTYYCAVATCGEILFGNGTRLDVEPAVDLIVIILGVSLAVCVVLIIILICTRKTRTVCENCKVSVTYHGPDKTTPEQVNGQEGEDLNYAALQFSEMKGKRGRRKRETPQESVYSDVRGSDWEGSGQQEISL